MTLPNTDWHTESIDELIDVITTLDDPETAAAFLRDLCTLRELEDMAQRWQVVKLLDAGHHYRDISQRTGASTATITRINQWLQHGLGGYKWMLEHTNGAP